MVEKHAEEGTARYQKKSDPGSRGEENEEHSDSDSEHENLHQTHLDEKLPAQLPRNLIRQQLITRRRFVHLLLQIERVAVHGSSGDSIDKKRFLTAVGSASIFKGDDGCGLKPRERVFGVIEDDSVRCFVGLDFGITDRSRQLGWVGPGLLSFRVVVHGWHLVEW